MNNHAPEEPLDTAQRATPPTPNSFRADIEGLRAIAVLLVVVYHAEIGPFHGGLVGVDVFFVVSGFLITSLLLREQEQTGRISLGNFWARRVRRLLPASLLVVVATLIAARSMLSPILLEGLGRDALAAVGFVINIVFGYRANDYLAGQMADVAPSALLHFWSLAVEEQFYLVWPLIVWGLTRFALRARTIAAVVGALGVASLVACLVLTQSSPVWAFYLLPTRAWELLAGAALALAGARLAAIPQAARSAIGWTGIAGIVVASLVISDTTSFPGYAALLPVIATAAVIAAGAAPSALAPGRLLGMRPLQWIGARSYAIYLWHWPALILSEAKWGPLDAPERTVVMTVAVLLAVLAHALVENPVRHSRYLGARARRSYALGVALVGIGLAASAITISADTEITGSGSAVAPTLVPVSSATPSTAVPATTEPDTPGSSDPGLPPEPTTTTPEPTLEELLARIEPLVADAVRTDAVPSNLVPPLSRNSAELPTPYTDDCLGDSDETEAGDCAYGKIDSTTSIAIVGDSHSAQWQPALASIAERRGWKLRFYAKRRCGAVAYRSAYNPKALNDECDTWRNNVIEELTQDPAQVVILTALRYPILDGLTTRRSAQWRSGFETVLDRLAATGSRLVLLGDPPLPPDWPGACLADHLKSATRCTIDRSDGEPDGLVQAEQAAAESTGATYVRTGDWFCSGDRCAVIIGNINVYRDPNHISIPAAMFFIPLLEAVLGPQVALARD